MRKLIFLLFICASTLANYPYLDFDTSSLKLNSYTYRRYIRPQLRSMKKDFYYVVKRITYTSQDFINLRENSLNLNLAFDEAYEKCRRNQKLCYEDLKDVMGRIQAIERNVKSLRDDFIKLPKKQYDKVDGYIALLSNLDQIDSYNLQIQSYVQLLHLTDKTNFAIYAPRIDKYRSYVKQIYNLANDSFLYILPTELKPSFEQFIDNFLSHVEVYMIPQMNKDWFFDRLGDLNMQWNVFHMDLEKGQTGFPKEYVRNVKIMHRRWNSILKLMF